MLIQLNSIIYDTYLNLKTNPIISLNLGSKLDERHFRYFAIFNND